MFKPKAQTQTPDNEKKVAPIKEDTEDGELKFIGNAPQIKKLQRILPKIARNNAPVLIQGESGTGKEVFAHQIHANSDRSEAQYIKINCANLPSKLVESTLFGHKKNRLQGLYRIVKARSMPQNYWHL